MIRDEFKLAAFTTMDVCLTLNGITLDYKADEVGSLIVKAAQGIVDELELEPAIQGAMKGLRPENAIQNGGGFIIETRPLWMKKGI